MITIEKYIPESYIATLQFQSFVIVEVQKEQASKFIQILRQLPTNFQQFVHLKRIRKQKDKSDHVDVLLCLQKDTDIINLIKTELGELIVRIKTEKIPCSIPSTKKQYVEWSQHWPINFVQQQIFKQIKHSPVEMELISKITSIEEQLILFNEANILYSIKLLQGCPEGTIHHPVMRMVEEWPKTMQYKALESVYYLTKLKLYCKGPLCGMCCMALVHSRLERIYFPSALDIKDISQILCCQKINHRVKILQVAQLKQ